MKDSKRFHNLDNITLTVTFLDFLRWRRDRRGKVKDLTFRVETAKTKEIAFLKENRERSSLTWIGHATFLLQLRGLNILTDPIWARRLGFAKRLVSPGMSLTELPEIDVVLISHNHYDHLEYPTLRKLPGNPVFLIPQGLASQFRAKSLQNFREFQWWQDISIKGVVFTFVPAQHWSKRTLWDTNQSLWGGWVITVFDKERSIYFVGDSGYFRGFKEIGTRFSIDAILAPIGCYAPEWFMNIQHVTPEEAVKAYTDVDARLFIPMHFEAFLLGDDTPGEALGRLQAEWERLALPEENLKLLNLGETMIYPENRFSSF